ncbi:MAG: cellulase family glycosylhydrolase [Thermotogae bacterium]|nr:cellulase family glycosylhydrolase [Thermotogota bacterium]
MVRKFLILVFIFLLMISSFGLSNSTVGSFVTIGPSKSYFELDGKPFIPIGFNYEVTWPNLDSLWQAETNLFGNKEIYLQAAEGFFAKLNAHGVNTLRIFFEYAHDPSGSSLFENPLGQINESLINVWNHIFEYAKKYDIYLIIEPFDPYWMSKNWVESPFNIKNGGPISSLDEFLINKEVIRDTEFRFKFMIDRWGSSSHILAWEINNEIDIWYGRDNASTIKRYIKTLSDFIVNYEDSKFGMHHLVTVSTAAPTLSSFMFNAFYENKNLDFFTTHLYLPAVNNPANTIDPAIQVSQAIAHNLSQMDYSKPYIDSEDGPINGWSLLPCDSYVEYYHNIMWAEFASGACGPGFRWNYISNSNTLIIGLDIYKALSDFIDSPGINWLNFEAHYDPSDIGIQGTVGDYIIPFSCGDKSARIVWILKDSRKNLSKVDFSAVNLEIFGVESGNYSVEFWNTYTGKILNSIRIKAINGSMSLKINFSKLKDMALKVYKD